MEKAIVLQTKPDTVLEGREEFIVSLVSADNNADISSTGRTYYLISFYVHKNKYKYHCTTALK